MPIAPSELILNEDQSIYHLHLRPEDLAQTVILVGDPGRVARVSDRFDQVEVRKSKREFITHTGRLGHKRLSVISTGIGTDNIDIVLNELDALVNIDFESRTPKATATQLDLVRVGTSGAIQPDIPVDALVSSQLAIGFDGLLHFYDSRHIQDLEAQQAFVAHTAWSADKSTPYVVAADTEFSSWFGPDVFLPGFTATNNGFYAPQGRRLRLDPNPDNLVERMQSFRYGSWRITNMEMETASIFGLARLLGHRAASLNCILANRATHTFSAHPDKAVDCLIEHTLERLTDS